MRARAGIILLGMLGLGVAVYGTTPGGTGWVAPCPFHWLTGLYCPGCGTLRGLHRLLHGSFAGAWRCNPLMVLCLPLLAYAVVSLASFAVFGRRLSRPMAPPVVAWVILAMIVAYGIARNIPAYPFRLLAPH